jgi:hypothetical protein
VLYYRIEGDKKTRKIKIAMAGEVTLEMARERAREFGLVINMGKDPAVWHYDYQRGRLRKRNR